MEGKHCAVCDKEGRHSCSGCRAVRYCSQDHQKTHWKVHQLDCKPYRIESSAERGDHLVASRNLKPGKIILEEDPLMIAPKREETPAVCLGCCFNLGGKGVDCPKCKWPMCGKKECWEEGSQHALGECSLLKEAGNRVTGNHRLRADKGVYQSILVLRCISLRDRDASKWDKLTEVKYCGSPRVLQSIGSRDRTAVVELLNQWLPDRAIPQELINKICGTFAISSFKLPAMDEKQSENLWAVYSMAGLIDHSCVANAIATYPKFGHITIRATVPISAGTKIVLNYANDPMSSTIKRFYDLKGTRFGVCRCERCMDPTELGTFTNGIRCFQCQEGILRPNNCRRLIETKWICNKCPCWKNSMFIAHFLSEALQASNDLDEYSGYYEYEDFISEYEQILHPNNYILTKKKLALCFSYTEEQYDDCPSLFNNSFIDDGVIDRKEVFVKELLEIADILSPGMSSFRGLLLYQLFTVGDFRVKQLRMRDLVIPDPELLPQMKEMRKVLMEASTILSWDMVGTFTGDLGKVARGQLEELDRFINSISSLQSMSFASL